MTGSQKALRVICVLTIVYAVLLLISGGVMLAGSSMSQMQSMSMNVNGTIASYSALALAFGIMFVVFGLVDLFIGILGFRGAKRPNKIGAFFFLAIIGLVMSIIGIIWSIMQGSFDTFSLINFVFTLLCVILARNVRKLAVK